jgi:hypothetical protein
VKGEKLKHFTFHISPVLAPARVERKPVAINIFAGII